MKNSYPVSEAIVRPFRIYDEKEQKILQGKCFSYALNAHNAAEVYAKWYLNIGETITVVTNTGNDLGQYTRRVRDVHASDNAPETLADVERQQRKYGGMYK